MEAPARRAPRRSLLLPVVFSATVASSCNWVSLAKNALTYRTIERGEAANLAALETLIYVTQAEDGLAIVDARSGSTVATFTRQ